MFRQYIVYDAILRMETQASEHLFIENMLQFHEVQARWTIKNI